MVRNMNLQQLEYFRVIAETKKITAASNALSISQPALSKAISKLEEELDVKLFERDGRNIKITKYGEVFLKYAESALDDIDRGIKKIEEMKNGNDQVISVATTNCIGITFIPFVISEFLNQYGHTKFNFNIRNTEDLFKDLRYERIHIGFFDRKEYIDKYPEIESIIVKKEEYVLIVSKNHYLSKQEEVYLKDLKEEYFIAYSGKNLSKKVAYTELLGYTPKISVEQSEESMLTGLVAAGAGIAIVLNTPMINTNKISIIKIKDNIGYKNIYMGWNKKIALPINSNQFKDYVISLEG